MRGSRHVTPWILLVVLTSLYFQCAAMSNEQCQQKFSNAEFDFYLDADHCKTTTDDQMQIQHGHGMLHKIHFLKRWLHDHHVSESDCPFHRHRDSTFNKANFHRQKRAGCTLPNITCDPSYPWRLPSGSCNNLANPTWGASNTAQLRLIPNAYADGVSEPRSIDCKGGELPSPRKVSNIIHRAGAQMLFHKRISSMVPTFGQFLAHDLALSGMFGGEGGEGLDCCGADADHEECFPIAVPDDDPYFTYDCLNFARTLFDTDCNVSSLPGVSQNASVWKQCYIPGVRQQLNLQTALVDASQIYGANKEEMDFLTDLSTGRLKESEPGMLYKDEDDMGCDVQPEDIDGTYCFKSGDIRVNEQPALVGMHTLFMREHNRIWAELKKINPHWSADMLFQTARKIVIAEMQVIVYTEWLPVVMGVDGIRRYGLKTKKRGCCYKDTYKPSVNPSIFNAFSTAGLRFGHSMVHRMIGKLDDSYSPMVEEELNTQFFKTNFIHKDEQYGTDNVLRWHIMAQCPLSDRMLEVSLQDKLFPDENNKTLDIAALNIQRGRDHGLPSYNEFRQLCGLPRATHFGTGPGGLSDHTDEVAALLDEAYECIDDIDLYPGIMSEKRRCGEVLGPTQKCLIGLQFRALRDGDRFWYEKKDRVTGFTKEQLKEIRKARMSRIICDNTDTTVITRNVFYRHIKRSRFNKMYDCNNTRWICKMDLRKWADKK